MEVTVNITLIATERELLLSILEEHHRELLREISRTQHHGFKAALKDDAVLVESMLGRLRGAGPAELAVAG